MPLRRAPTDQLHDSGTNPIKDLTGNLAPAFSNLLVTATAAPTPAGTALTYPSDISTTFPNLPTIYKSGTTYATNAAAASFQPTTGAIAYSSPTASAGGAGTRLSPKRLTELLADASIGTIFLEEGEYNNVWTAAPASRNLAIICNQGKAQITRYETAVTWVAQGDGTYLAQNVTGPAGMVQDFSVWIALATQKR